MSKVLFVSHNHPRIRPGGAECYALDLYEEIRDRAEFEAVFLARTGAPSPTQRGARQHPGTPVSSVTADPNQYLLYTNIAGYDYLFQRSADKETITRDYADFLRAHRPDIVHFQHNYLIGYDFLRVTRNVLPDAPIVYMLHEYLAICHHDGQLIRTQSREICREQTPRRCHECFPHISPHAFFLRERFIRSHLRLVDVFIAPSDYVKDRYVDWGIPAEKIQVESCALKPIDLPVDEPRSERNRFVFSGQFTPYKGTDVLLEAMALLGDDFDGHLWLYGANIENYVPETQKRFRELLDAVPNTVTFAGPYDRARDLTRIMMSADWVVVPSIWWETGPLTVFEAFQHRRPVICSDIGGMAEKVTDGVNGLHFLTGDAEDLARVMQIAVDTRGLWDRLHAGVPPVPDMRDHAEVVSDIYRRLLARTNGSAGNGVVTAARVGSA